MGDGIAIVTVETEEETKKANLVHHLLKKGYIEKGFVQLDIIKEILFLLSLNLGISY